MAALTYPGGVFPQRSLRLVETCTEFQVGGGATVVSLTERRRRRERTLRRRRGVALAGSALVLSATWGLSGLIAGRHAASYAVLAHSVPVNGGFRYTVQPGDTVWSIATALDPSGDPRPIVASLDARLGGTSIVPGEQIIVP